MKEEIKEILDYWQFYINEPNNYKLLNVHFDEIKRVLDYITNLQEEIKFTEDYKDAYETTMIAYKMIEEKYNDYKQRNEKVIQYIDSLFNTIDYKDEEFITFDTLQNIQDLAKYGQLKGDKDE